MSTKKYNIAILGLGAVGGYYGAKLASHYANSNEVEITFITRGENAQAIKTNGIKLITPDGELFAHPNTLIDNSPLTINNWQIIPRTIDLLILSTKSYDLEASLQTLKEFITPNTIILPLLNGVDAKERIQKLLPTAQVWEGCVYIVSRLTAPGVIQVTGTNNVLHIGSEHANQATMEHVHTLLKSAGINIHLAENITQKMWEKYLFISPLATITSYTNQTVGPIVQNRDLFALFLALFDELFAISGQLKIQLPSDTKEKIITRINSLSPEITSSMHSDFQKHSRNELDTLTGYIVRTGERLGVPTPTYNTMYTLLLNR